MNLDDLQAELAERGCVLWVEGEMLRFKAPDGALTPPLMSQLRRNKRALIERLRGDAQHGGDGANPPGGSGANPPSGDVGPTREPSYGQQAMWLLHQAVPLSPAYNVASAVQVHGPIDYGAVERVWRTLLTRHDSLRTTFQLRGGRLAACVQQQPATDAKRVLVPTEAGPAAGPAAVDAELRRLVDASYRAPFDLTAGPLARLRLFSVGETRHVLLLSMHHIVLDAWSLWVLHDEFGALYRQESRGEVGVLLAAEASYGDFVRWQQALPDSEAGRSQWQSWRQRLAGCPEPARLVWDRRRPAARAQRGASLHFRLPAELSGQLRELGRQRGATPFMTLLAVFQALLHLHSGQRDFVVGTTSSGRSEPRFARLVGYLVNTLPLRAKIEPGCRFSGLLEQTRGEVIAAIGAQDFPFPLTVQRLNPPRESGALPLCRVMFGLQKPHDFSEAMIALDDASRSIDWGGLRASTYELDQQEGQFDLTLEMYETSTTFLGILKYDTALLDRETAQLLAARYRRLAELVVADPDASLETLELAATDERRLLDAWQSGADAAATLPVESPASVLAKAVTRLDGLFAAAADAQPDAVAIQSDGTWLTYRQADSRANQIARWLAERGVAAGSPVGCCVRRGADAWLAHLACLKAGAVYVPLDDAGPTARLANLLRDCGAAVLLSDTETAVSLGLAAAELPARLELIDESADEIALQDTAPPSHAATADEAAYVIYTSGSTGEPKGVAVSHAAMLHHLRRVLPVYGVAEADRVLQFSAMTFDPSLEQAWSAWSAGAALVVRGPRLWSPSEFWTQAAGQGVTVANLPPAYFREVTAAKKALAEQPAALRLVIVGGDAFPQDTLAAWRGSGTRLLNAYGPTEAVVTSTVADVTDFDPASGRAPIGRPLPGTRAYVVNEHGRPAPVGVPGELLLASDALALGYLNDAERTGSRFAPAAGLTGDDRPVYRTGDRARWNHRGQLELLGRIDRQVKVNGYRVELGEVEQAILATPGVCGAVAKLQTAGDGVELVAYYTTSGKTDGVDPATLTAALRRRLPHYMTPSAMALLDDLPRNPSGKVAIDALPPLAADRVASAAAYAGPQNELQRVLTEVWSDVLGVERVGIHDDFFELGGASLKSLQIVSAAEARGLRLPNEAMSPALLFEYPTIAQLATLLTIGGAPAAAAPAG